MKSNKLVQLLYGNEKFLLDEYVDNLKKNLNSPDLNYIMYEEGKITITQLLDSAMQVPFLDKYRIIVYKTSDFIKYLSKIPLDELKSFSEYISNPVDTAILIIITENLDKRTKLYKELSSSLNIEEFSPLNKIQFNNWLDAQFSFYNIKIAPREKEYFASLCEYLDKNTTVSLYDIQSQILKLSLIKNIKINTSHIDNVLNSSRNKNIYQFIDQIFDHRTSASVKSLKVIISNKVDPVFIYSQILRQISIILRVHICKENNIKVEDISDILSLKPFIIQKALNQIKYFSHDNLFSVFNLATKLDYKVKTGQLDCVLAIQIIISKISSIKKVKNKEYIYK